MCTEKYNHPFVYASLIDLILQAQLYKRLKSGNGSKTYLSKTDIQLNPVILRTENDKKIL